MLMTLCNVNHLLFFSPLFESQMKMKSFEEEMLGQQVINFANWFLS